MVLMVKLGRLSKVRLLVLSQKAKKCACGKRLKLICSAHKPLIIIAGADYGQGSSRDWAAKGVRLAGVETIIAEGFERIHRTNLVGMGVLPLEFTNGETRTTYQIDGSEVFDVEG